MALELHRTALVLCRSRLDFIGNMVRHDLVQLCTAEFFKFMAEAEQLRCEPALSLSPAQAVSAERRYLELFDEIRLRMLAFASPSDPVAKLLRAAVPRLPPDVNRSPRHPPAGSSLQVIFPSRGAVRFIPDAVFGGAVA
jgi:hypothetical protein